MNENKLPWRNPYGFSRETIIILLIVLIFMAFITSIIFPSNLFEKACLKRGGDFGELQNVSCAIGKSYCALYCNINGTVINYYDKSELRQYTLESKGEGK